MRKLKKIQRQGIKKKSNNRNANNHINKKQLQMWQP